MGPENYSSIGETFAGPFFFSWLSTCQVEEISILSHREKQAIPSTRPTIKKTFEKKT